MDYRQGNMSFKYSLHIPGIFQRFKEYVCWPCMGTCAILLPFANNQHNHLTLLTLKFNGVQVSKSWSTVSTSGNSDWFSKQADMVKKVVSMMPVHFQVNYKETINSDQLLTVCSSDVFYIPRRFIADFTELVNLVDNLEIHHKVAIPMFFLSMDSPQNFDPVLSRMIYEENPPSTNSSTFYSDKVPAVHPWNVSSEQEFIKLIRIMATGDLLLLELV